jgi:hypothetical protein
VKRGIVSVSTLIGLDRFVRRLSPQRLEVAGKVVGCQVDGHLSPLLPVSLIVVGSHGTLLAPAEHALDLSLGPRVICAACQQTG